MTTAEKSPNCSKKIYLICQGHYTLNKHTCESNNAVYQKK